MQVDVSGSGPGSVLDWLVLGSPGSEELVPGSLDAGELCSVLGSALLEESLLGPGFGLVRIGVVPGPVLPLVDGIGAAGVLAAGAPGGFDPPPATVDPALLLVVGGSPVVGMGAQPVSLDVPVTTVAVPPSVGAGCEVPAGFDRLVPSTDTEPVDEVFVLPVVVVCAVDDVTSADLLEAVVPTVGVAGPGTDVEVSTVSTGA